MDLFRGLYFSLKFFDATVGHVGTNYDFLTDIFSELSPNFLRSVFCFFSFYPGACVPGSVPFFLVFFGVFIC